MITLKTAASTIDEMNIAIRQNSDSFINSDISSIISATAAQGKFECEIVPARIVDESYIQDSVSALGYDVKRQRRGDSTIFTIKWDKNPKNMVDLNEARKKSA